MSFLAKSDYSAYLSKAMQSYGLRPCRTMKGHTSHIVAEEWKTYHIIIIIVYAKMARNSSVNR